MVISRCSFLCYQDIESTEHDGDVEDYSEGESSYTKRPLYIPSHDEPNRFVFNVELTIFQKVLFEEVLSCSSITRLALTKPGQLLSTRLPKCSR